ncbi:MAG: NAD(+) synthase [Bacteroidales bacterium OttesenSCG-928-I14]|jgi:NAD+ synthase (glutamine-hydrolysing)|nr:NAD(+) synthase [Bacteroidales bacterium OttesenSCG-928-I14]
MENFGFLKIAVSIPQLKVADCNFNIQQIAKLVIEANNRKVKIVCFPELSISSYTCEDLFLQKALIEGTKEALLKLLDKTKKMPICFIVGTPVEYNSKLYNCAVICQNGEIKGIVPKMYLPNYCEFYEKRWFEPYIDDEHTIITYANNTIPFGQNLLFSFGSGSIKFSTEICEDLWAVIPPSSSHAIAGAQLIFNLSASNELVGKQRYIKSLIAQQSARCHVAYAYSSSNYGESTSNLVYSGNAYIYENGKLLMEAKRFHLHEQLLICEIDIDLLNSERRKNTSFIGKSTSNKYKHIIIKQNLSPNLSKLERIINSAPFIPSSKKYNENCKEIFSIQIFGLAKRIIHTNAKSLIIGISGGLDSTLALLVCIKTIDKLNLSRKMIYGITMPGVGTSQKTYQNAWSLMKSLDINSKKIDITTACTQHFKDIGHDTDVYDVTYENAQARERTQILMDLANQLEGIVIGTSNMSELALGWTTYNGDHMSMYGINTGLPKTLISHLIKWVANTQSSEFNKIVLSNIINTPISPELLPTNNKKRITHLTEDIIGPYELHDFFMYHTLRYGFSPKKIYFLAKHAFFSIYTNNTILKWMKIFYKRFFESQFKRNCIPDGPKIGSIGLSPRSSWRMPSDAIATLWTEEINLLIKNELHESP